MHHARGDIEAATGSAAAPVAARAGGAKTSRKSTGTEARSRLRSLDGLRGIACVIVLLHHLSMTVPSVSNAYDSADGVVPFSPAWWAVESPLKIFVAGPEFVLVFFVLSGYVLSLGPLKPRSHPRVGSGLRRGYDWAAYYPRRAVRIGLPAAVSVVLATVVVLTLPHPLTSGLGSWLERQARPSTEPWRLIGQALLIVDPRRPSINAPLWSLTWEMWFSILLPLSVLLVFWCRRMPVVCGLLLLGASAYGYVMGVPGASYLPAFGLGVVLAQQAPRIQEWTGSRSRASANTIWGGIAVLGAAALIAFWMLRPLIGEPWLSLALGLRVPGATALVAAAAFWPAAMRLLGIRPLVWLGMISFSLYLVHSPIVITTGLNFTGSQWWIGAVIAVAASFAMTLVMYVLIEKPSRRWASALGRRVSEWWSGMLRLAPAPAQGEAHAEAARVEEPSARELQRL